MIEIKQISSYIMDSGERLLIGGERRQVLGEEERISIETGLGAVTQNAAFQYFAESEKGSLRAGKRADFVLLSGDPRKTAPEDLKKLQVEETIKDGRSLWRR